MIPHVNLLPVKYRRQQAAKRILSRWGFVGSVVLVVMFIHWYQESSHSSYLAEEIFVLEQEAQPINIASNTSAKIQSDLKRLHKKWAVLSKLIPNDDILQTMGAVGVACGTTDKQVRVKNLSLNVAVAARLSRPEKISKKDSRSIRPNEPSKLTMQVHASSDSTVAKLVGDLKKHPRFAKVELKRVGGSSSDESRVVELHGDIVVSGEQL